MKKLPLILFCLLATNISVKGQILHSGLSIDVTGFISGVKTVEDHHKNIYVSGLFMDSLDLDPGPGTAYVICPYYDADIFLAKYDSAGNYIWGFKIVENSLQSQMLLYCDDDGNVYISASFNGTVDFDPGPGVASMFSYYDPDPFIAKYDSNGNYVWAFEYGNGHYLEINELAFDHEGHFYVTGGFSYTLDFNPGSGTANRTSTSYAAYIAKYDVNKNFLWVNSLGSLNAVDFTGGYSITVDHSGNVLATGRLEGQPDFDPSGNTYHLPVSNGFNVFVAKYDSTSNLLWAFGLYGSPITVGYIRTDNSDNVYLTGGLQGGLDLDPSANSDYHFGYGALDIFFAKYTSGGSWVWGRSIGGSGDEINYGFAIDSLNQLYLIGFFSDTVDFDPDPSGVANLVTSTSRGFVAKYDEDGKYRDAFSLGGEPQGIDLEQNGRLLIAGAFGGTVDFDPGDSIYDLTATYGLAGFFATYDLICLSPHIDQLLPEDTSICAGEPVTLSITGTLYDALEWNWFSGSCSGSPVGGGDSITVSPEISTTFYMNGQLGCINNANYCDSIHVMVHQLPAVVAHASDTLSCNGGEIMLSGSGTALQYFWNNGAENDILFIPQTSANYVVTGIDSNGCSNTDSLFITVVTTDTTVTVIADTLFAHASNAMYQWMNCSDMQAIAGATYQTFSPSFNGSYSVVITQNGCSDTSGCYGVEGECFAYFTLIPDTLIPHHYWLMSEVNGIPPINYLWNWGDGSTDSGPFPNHAYADSGFYTICLSIHDSTGCGDSTCINYDLMKLGSQNTIITVDVVDSIPGIVSGDQNTGVLQSWSVFPNPASEHVFINYSLSTPAIVTIEMHDILGNAVQQLVNDAKAGEYYSTIDIQKLSNGIYFLQIRARDQVVSQKILVIK